MKKHLAVITMLLGIVTVLSVCGVCIYTKDDKVNEEPETTLYAGYQQTQANMLSVAKAEFLQNAKTETYNRYKEAMEEEAQKSIHESIVVEQSYYTQLDTLKEERASEMSDYYRMQHEDFLSAANTNKNDTENATEISDSENNTSSTTKALLNVENIDESYKGSVVVLTDDNRYLLERLVQGEAGNQGFIGAALVAQTIHDTMLADNDFDVMSVKRQHSYDGKVTEAPCQDVKDAVAFIFDDGGMAVQHRLIYFYNPARVRSSFHERQQFVVEYKQHKFFDEVK